MLQNLFVWVTLLLFSFNCRSLNRIHVFLKISEMSAILQSNKRLTTSYSFYKLPAVAHWNTLAITPAPHSNGASSVSSVSTKSRARNIDREEPCFITKSVSYTHERAHWVNAVRKDSVLKEQVVRAPSNLVTGLVITLIGVGELIV